MSLDLLITHDGPVLRVTINREERRNAISSDVLHGIAAAFDRAEADRSIRVIVLTGAGDKAFCAGADLQADAFKLDPSEPYQRYANLLRRSRQLTVPVVARVNGACMAGGMGLMAMADMVVAHERAVFGLPEVKVGVLPAQVLAILSGLIHPRLLNELVITGEPMTAAEAREAGLINYVAADLDAKTDWLVARIVDKSPAAIRRAVYTMKRLPDMPFEAAAAFAEGQITMMAATEDAKEGTAAFREKRKPKWTGK